MTAMAAKIELSPEMLSRLIADNLPKLIDKMTPLGAVTTDAGIVLGAMLSLVK